MPEETGKLKKKALLDVKRWRDPLGGERAEFEYRTGKHRLVGEATYDPEFRQVHVEKLWSPNVERHTQSFERAVLRDEPLRAVGLAHRFENVLEKEWKRKRGKVGYSAMRNLLRQVKTIWPEAQEVITHRATGATSKFRAQRFRRLKALAPLALGADLLMKHWSGRKDETTE